jgi:hypothetical protein
MSPAMMVRIGIGRRDGDAHEADGKHRGGKKCLHEVSLPLESWKARQG